MGKGKEEQRGTVPDSGRILGAIVQAFDLTDEAFRGPTARRYFAGETIGDDSLKEIYRAMGNYLVESGIVPVPMMLGEHNRSMAIVTGAILARLATRWENFHSTLPELTVSQKNKEAIEEFCRSFVIDMSLRGVAWFRLAKKAPPEPQIPPWAFEDGIQVTSRDIKANTVQGSQNSTGYLQEMAVFACLADMMAEHIGRKQVIDMASALHRFIWLISEDIEGMERPPIEEAAGLELAMLRYGVEEPDSHILLENLLSVEEDEKWQKAIAAIIKEGNKL